MSIENPRPPLTPQKKKKERVCIVPIIITTFHKASIQFVDCWFTIGSSVSWSLSQLTGGGIFHMEYLESSMKLTFPSVGRSSASSRTRRSCEPTFKCATSQLWGSRRSASPRAHFITMLAFNDGGWIFMEECNQMWQENGFVILTIRNEAQIQLSLRPNDVTE